MLAVNGDAVLGLTRLMNHGAYHKERPLSMDLLWTVRTSLGSPLGRGLGRDLPGPLRPACGGLASASRR